MELCSGFCPSWTCSLRGKVCVCFFFGKKETFKEIQDLGFLPNMFQICLSPHPQFPWLSRMTFTGKRYLRMAKTLSWTLQSCLILEQSLEPPSWKMANQLHIFLGEAKNCMLVPTSILPTTKLHEHFRLELVVYNTCVYIYIAHKRSFMSTWNPKQPVLKMDGNWWFPTIFLSEDLVHHHPIDVAKQFINGWVPSGFQPVHLVIYTFISRCRALRSFEKRRGSGCRCAKLWWRRRAVGCPPSDYCWCFRTPKQPPQNV